MASSTRSSFKELCLDTTRQDGLTAAYWAGLTGCRHERDAADPIGDVVGDQEGMGIAICPVPEEKTVKNRVHLDVSVASLDEVTDRGGVRVADVEHWTVCRDPEGNEFCAFVRDAELPAYRVFEIVVDSVDPERIAIWWAGVFGVEANHKGDVWWLQEVPGFPTAGPFFAMVFVPVPEPKTVKNRMHWDIYGDVSDVVASGATHRWEIPRWTVLADPEGNEFCVFADG